MTDPKSLAREKILEITPYKPGKPIEEVRRELGLEEIIKLASNENSLGPSKLALKAMEERLSDVCLYPDSEGYELKRALSRKLEVEESEIAIGSGSCELIELILKAFVNPGDEVLSSQYGFLMFMLATQIVGGENVVVEAKDYGHDLEAMVEAITPRTKVLFIANPNNPTGTMNTAEEVELFMSKAPANVVVVFDEVYYEFVDREDYPRTFPYVKEGRNVIILRSFSKIYGLAGLRIGYAIAKEELVWLINQVKQPFNTTTLAQIGAVAALEDEEHVRMTLELNKKGKECLYSELGKLGLFYLPSQANFVLINLKVDAEPIFDKLLREGVVVRPLRGYGLPTCIRVTVGTPEQNEKFINALKKVMSK